MNGCKFDGREYSEGSIICCNDKELKCSGGEWVETGLQCDGVDDQSGGILSGLGISRRTSGEQSKDEVGLLNFNGEKYNALTQRTLYTYKIYAYRSGNRLQGKWARSRADLCLDNVTPGYIFEFDVVEREVVNDFCRVAMGKILVVKIDPQ